MDTATFVSTIAGSARSGAWFLTGLSLLIGTILAQPARADLAPENVLVVYNAEDAESQEVASYYAQKRPGVQLLGLTGVTTAEEVTADYYLANIRPKILPALNDSIDVIATTMGLPLRISVSESNPGSYTDPFGVPRTVGSSDWKRYSSLESELARIDTVSTWEQMGDQSTFLAPAPVLTTNPYYASASGFSHEQFGTRLTSRLDAFSVADAKGMIDRAKQAFVGSGTPTDPFHFVIDDDPNAPGASADHMEALRETVLEPRGLPYTYDGSNAFVQDATSQNPNPLVLGYVSHGVYGGAPAHYLEDPVNGIHFELANGAVFHSWESYNAKTFDPDVSHSQGLVAEWIERGGTAALGHVAEPYVGFFTVAHEDILFDRLLSGMTWAEAAWSATYQLSYVNTAVGDPLMRLRTWIPGDANLNGAVTMSDYNQLLTNWAQPASVLQGDFNGDGTVSFADFSVLLTNWGASSPEGGGGAGGGVAAGPVPEPTSFVLAGLAMLGLRRLVRRRG